MGLSNCRCTETEHKGIKQIQGQIQRNGPNDVKCNIETSKVHALKPKTYVRAENDILDLERGLNHSRDYYNYLLPCRSTSV